MALTGKSAQWGGWQHRDEHLAPLTSNSAHGRGWQLQADQLVSTHAAVGTAAVAVAGQARQRPSSKRVTRRLRFVGAEIESGLDISKTEFANALEPPPAKFAAPVQQVAQETTAARILNKPRKTQVTAADKRVAELKRERDSAREGLASRKNENRFLQTPLNSIVNETLRLSQCLTESAAAADEGITQPDSVFGSAREEFVHRENENRSLQTSLDLLISENARLSRCLTERDAADNRLTELEGKLGSAREELVIRENENRSLQTALVGTDKARSQLEQMKTALIAAEIELNKLVYGINETNEKRQTEISTLHVSLEAMSSRAATAEKLLVDAQQSWLVRIEENSIAERKLADATEACNVAEKKLELLQSLFQLKEREVQQLEESRSKLTEGIDTLLRAFKTRDTALARAEEMVKMLAVRVAQLEMEASQKKIDELNSQLQCGRMVRAIAEVAPEKACTNFAEPQQELDNYVEHNSEREGSQVRAARSLLAGTLTFGNSPL
jgi:DNA-directed RNA polymerase subunit F